MKIFGPKDIKIHLEKILRNKKNELQGKKVIDLPAGNGISSAILNELGADVEPYDLLPDFFIHDTLNCKFADLAEPLPIEDNYADFVLCQEGIEHIPDQVNLFKEFNRITKKGGSLLITTPNESKLRSKLSFILAESEYVGKSMPHNEIDSIWFSGNDSDKIYYGHLFLIGIQRLRTLAKLNGFAIKKIHHIRANHTSVLLLIPFYPFIFLSNWKAYFKHIKKHPARKNLYKEITKLNTSIKLLVDGHLCVEFVKEEETENVSKNLKGKFLSYDVAT